VRAPDSSRGARGSKVADWAWLELFTMLPGYAGCTGTSPGATGGRSVVVRVGRHRDAEEEHESEEDQQAETDADPADDRACERHATALLAARLQLVERHVSGDHAHDRADERQDDEGRDRR